MKHTAVDMSDADAATTTREKILAAALEEFAQHGYQGVSVRALNRKLNISHNLIHRYFGSKKGLWKAAADYGMGQLAEEIWLLQEDIKTDDPVELLSIELQRFIELTSQNLSMQRILEREASLGGDRLDYMVEHYILPSLQRSTKFFEDVIDINGRKLEPRTLVLLITSGATAFFTQAALTRKLGEYIGGADPFSAEAVENHTRSVIDVLLYGLVGKSSKDESRRHINGVEADKS